MRAAPAEAPAPRPDADPDRPPRSEADADGPPAVLDLLYGVLFQPRATFAALAPRPPLRLAFLVLVAVAVLQGLAAPAALPGGAPGSLGLAVVAMVMLVVLLWLGSAAVWHLAAELLGGRGTARSLLALTGLAGLPGVFGAPAELLGRVTGLDLFGLLGLAVVIWSFVLNVLAVRAVYGLSTGRSLAVVLAPVLAVGVIAVLLATLVLGAMLGSGVPLPPLRP